MNRINFMLLVIGKMLKKCYVNLCFLLESLFISKAFKEEVPVFEDHFILELMDNWSLMPR